MPCADMNRSTRGQVTRDPLRRQATRTVLGNFITPCAGFSGPCRSLSAVGSIYLPSAAQQATSKAEPPGRGRGPLIPPPPRTGNPKPKTGQEEGNPPLYVCRIDVAFCIFVSYNMMGNFCYTLPSPCQLGGVGGILKAYLGVFWRTSFRSKLLWQL